MSEETQLHNITIMSDGSAQYLVMPGTPKENNLKNIIGQYESQSASGTKVLIWVVGCKLTEAEALMQARPLLGKLR